MRHKIPKVMQDLLDQRRARTNPVAKALSNPVTRPRTERDLTRYTRTQKHKEQPDEADD